MTIDTSKLLGLKAPSAGAAKVGEVFTGPLSVK